MFVASYFRTFRVSGADTTRQLRAAERNYLCRATVWLCQIFCMPRTMNAAAA